MFSGNNSFKLLSDDISAYIDKNNGNKLIQMFNDVTNSDNGRRL